MAAKLEWIRTVIRHNWELKLLAIALAVMAVYGIIGATGSEVTLREVPLQVVVDDGIAILDQHPKTVRITFRGTSSDLLRLDQRQIETTVRAKASDPAGSETLLLKPGNVRHRAMGVRVVSIEPQTVRLVFDREVKMTLPVAKPEISGTPLLGKVEIDYEPREVTIRGPKRALEDERFVKTEPVNVEGAAASFSTRVPVLLPREIGVVRVDPPDVLVTVNIVTETVSREWTNVVILAAFPEGSVARPAFEPGAVSVSLHGRSEVLDSIPDGAIRAFVDCTDLDPSTSHEAPVVVHVPAGLDVTATVVPERVRAFFVPLSELEGE